MNMSLEQLKQDIKKLEEIRQLILDHWFDNNWDLSDFYQDEICRITGHQEYHQCDWNEVTLAYYIDGMNRVIDIIGVINE